MPRNTRASTPANHGAGVFAGLCAGFIAAFGLAHGAAAAELRVFSTIAVQAPLEEMIPRFEASSGHKLTVEWATASMLIKRVEAGEKADVLILTDSGLEQLAKEGKVVPSSMALLASAPVAIGIKAGTPKPDISTAEALKRSLLAAKAISYTDPATGGASGVYFAKLLERLGIAVQMKPKTRFPPPGGFSATLLQTGEVEIAIQQKSELLHVPGTEVIGLLPGELNMATNFSTGLGAGSGDMPAAKALVNFLHSPEAAVVLQKTGLNTP